MLVLSRKSQQSLVINHDVVVTVVEIGEEFVGLSIDAPNEPEVRRRYPQSLAVPRADGDRPVIVTLSLHDGAILDRVRRRMADDEGTPPSRDDALAALLAAVSDTDDFPLPRLAGRSIRRP